MRTRNALRYGFRPILATQGLSLYDPTRLDAIPADSERATETTIIPMPFKQFDRSQLKMRNLAARKNRVVFDRDRIDPASEPKQLTERAWSVVRETADRIRRAREQDRPRIAAFGAHVIKNGLSPVLIRLIEEGWLTHLATNGAGIIHDWEFAFLGESSEHVQANMERGEFGLWEETGHYLNLALVVGAYRGLGYGESVGRFVEEDGLEIPTEQDLLNTISQANEDPEHAAAAADLLATIRSASLEPGPLRVEHPYKEAGLQAAAYRLGVPFTAHPMIGHDILYMHPTNHCAAIGRAAQRDFLTFAEAISRLEDGVYLSIGSAVMSPMVFEKSMSMAQNLALQQGSRIENHYMVVVDLAESQWDWSQGEPPEDHPDYYLRYYKTFSRMGGTLRYACADNRDFLLGLLQTLESD